MQTVKIYQLRPHIKRVAIGNYRSDTLSILDFPQSEVVKTKLVMGFIFNSTTQGHSFWLEMSKQPKYRNSKHIKNITLCQRLKKAQ